MKNKQILRIEFNPAVMQLTTDIPANQEASIEVEGISVRGSP